MEIARSPHQSQGTLPGFPKPAVWVKTGQVATLPACHLPPPHTLLSCMCMGVGDVAVQVAQGAWHSQIQKTKPAVKTDV